MNGASVADSGAGAGAGADSHDGENSTMGKSAGESTMTNGSGHHQGQIENLVLVSCDERETFIIGSILGQHVSPGTLIGLIGPLGAGKTHFVQGLARGMGIDSRVRISSPTYTYVNEYQAPTMPLYHMDLYRISTIDELEELGYRDFYFGEGVCAVEWFDRVPEAMPQAYLEVIIEVIPEGRRLSFRAVHGHSLRALAPLARGWYAHKPSREGV